MITPQYNDGQFVDAAILNAAMTEIVAGNFNLLGDTLHYPGLINPSAMSLTPSLLSVNIQAAGLSVLFGSTVAASVVQPNGTVAGSTTTNYTVNFSSLVPGSGSVTAYIVAGYTQIGQGSIEVTGPPVGHPDYNPNFSPVQAWTELLDSLTFTATLTAPDNVGTFEIARTTLTHGQTSISTLDTSHQVYASAVLSPTNAAGTYNFATVTINSEGRITAASSGYAPFKNQVVISSSQTFTVPSGKTLLRVRLVGAGGSGGGSDGTSYSGGGGGAGGYCEGIMTVTPLQTIPAVVGAGGAATQPGNNGNAGGSTSFGSFSATGGSGTSTSSGVNGIAGGSPGVGSGGTVNLYGGYGADGTATSNLVTSGCGGASYFGGGGRAGSGQGIGGAAPGSGGGGGYGAYCGSGSGANGIIIVEY